MRLLVYCIIYTLQRIGQHFRRPGVLSLISLTILSAAAQFWRNRNIGDAGLTR